VSADIAELPLTQGKRAIVDRDIYDQVAAFKWHAHKEGERWYALRNPGRPRKGMIRLHRFVMGLPLNEIEVDHINRDGLDNRRCNLRLATRAQNGANSKRPITNTSGYKGVVRYSRGVKKKWRAQITKSGKSHSLGYFSSPKEAATAYAAAAPKVFGEFARP
jgi:hypothetical protein